MKSHTPVFTEKKSDHQVQQQKKPQQYMPFVDQRDSHTHQRKLIDMAANSPQIQQHKSQIDHINQSALVTTQLKQQHTLTSKTLQRAPEEEELPTATAQRVEEDELNGNSAPAQRVEATKPNNTGLPDNLKSGIESLSGMSMDHVKVHYNSAQPAQLNALAYAQGSDIHVAPGQEQHLPHEAWHVVQQAQGRVKPTMQMKEGVPVNDDAGLEHEADVMGAKALQLNTESNKTSIQKKNSELRHTEQPHSIQRKIAVTGGAPGATYEENTNVFETEEVAATGNVADYVAQPDDPATNPNKDYAGTNTAGYLLNVSSMNKSGAPADVHQGDIEAVYTVRRYNQGFENANEAKNRLRMVINVNQYDDARTTDDIRTLLTDAIATQRGKPDIANSPGKVAIIGHLWRHKWKRSDTNAPVTVGDVKTEYQNQLATGSTPEALKAGYGKVKFGFGTMREKTFKHAQTGNFYNHLNNRHLQTFVHLGDGDVIDVKKGADNKGVYDRMDTWRGASAANRNKKLVGGGVEYKGQNQGGDAPNDQGKLVKVLSDIDMNNRDSMATVDGKAPWMTEPNTFIDYTALAGIHGAWKNQPNFMVDVGSFLSGLVGADEATFNAQDLSIVSSANTHKVTPTGNTRPSVKNFIKELKNYKDSSFDPMSWCRRVKSTLDMAGAGRSAGEAGKLCLAIMHGKVAAIDNAEADIRLKNVFIDHGETRNAIAVPQTREARVAVWGETNVAKVEAFADQLVIQIKAAWAAYQGM